MGHEFGHHGADLGDVPETLIEKVALVEVVPDLSTTREGCRLRIQYHDQDSRPHALSLQWSDALYALTQVEHLLDRERDSIDWTAVRERLLAVYGMSSPEP